MALRIGVLGGTFDPPHIGHLAAAVNVRYALSLDRVLLVVASVPWQKAPSRPISAPEHRVALVERAVEGISGVEASRIEVDRGGDSVTADTVEALRAQHPGAELFMIVGADTAAGLLTWRRVDTLREHATVVAVNRPGLPRTEPVPGWRWLEVDIPRLDVSSSDLRRRAADGRPLDVLVPRGVLDVIRELRLYGLAA